MRILILGAGAVGGYFGGKLVEEQQRQSLASNSSSFHVTFLVRCKRAEQIKRDGLLLQNPDGKIASIQNVSTILSDKGDDDAVEPLKFDVIVLACKAYGFTGALAAIAKYVHPQVAILPLLNGMAHLDQIQERFPSATVWGGTCGIVASLDAETGIIKRMTPAQFVKAGLLPNSTGNTGQDSVLTFIQLLKNAGIEAELSDDIWQSMWDKFTFLATLGAATCLMNAPLGQIISTDYGQGFVFQLYNECNNIAAAEGSLPADPEGRQKRYQNVLVDRSCIVKASMCRDMESGKPTEADHLIHDLIQRGTKHGISTPMLCAAYTKLQIHERHLRANSAGGRYAQNSSNSS